MISNSAIPKEFICPITQKIMFEPVIASDGNTYEKEAIEEWLEKRSTSPVTHKKLESKLLIPNLHYQRKISQFIKLNSLLFKNNRMYLPKSLISKLILAIEKNDIIAVHKLLQQHPSLLTAYLKDNYTAFHYMCEKGSVTMLKYFIQTWYDYLPNIASLPKPFKWLPIHLWDFVDEAFDNNNQDLVNFLVWLGAKSPSHYYYDIPNSHHNNDHTSFIHKNLSTAKRELLAANRS